MIYKFRAYGHQNILATHKTTLEFTKDKELSLKGDCIIGVKADFDLDKLKYFIKKAKNKIIITIETSDKKIKETINAELNREFNHDRELVIRKTNFVSDRTLAINANKAAFELERMLTAYLRQKESRIAVILEVE